MLHVRHICILITLLTLQVHIVREGDVFSVSCVAGGNPPPLIEWKRGNDIISENVTLTLEQVSVNDTGEQHYGKICCSVS